VWSTFNSVELLAEEELERGGRRTLEHLLLRHWRLVFEVLLNLKLRSRLQQRRRRL